MAGLMLLAAGCGAAYPRMTEMASTSGGFTLESSAFGAGGQIPRRHSCEGDDVSPALSWRDAPPGVRSFALIVDDPSARGFVHWVVADIAGDAAGVPEGARPGDGLGAAAVEGRNDFGRVGWAGPCPPRGAGDHRYTFTLYALSEPLGLRPGVSAADVRAAAASRTLGSAVLEGLFGR
jgi:Raf kinase inhibitor-like YbhB/YbcL family protein